MSQIIFNAKVHLDVAIRQSIDKDDQIIMNHVREAKRLLDELKEGPPGTDLIDRAALLKVLNKERDDYVRENGAYDSDTGFTEFGHHGNEYYGEMCERIESIENFPSQPKP